MLKDNFFSIIDYSTIDDRIVDFQIQINKDHSIYQAHFPGNPITPGVCIIQIARELFAFLHQADFLIKKIKSVKFTQAIIPTENDRINYKIEWKDADSENLIRLQAIIYAADTVFTKIDMQLMQSQTD